MARYDVSLSMDVDADSPDEAVNEFIDIITHVGLRVFTYTVADDSGAATNIPGARPNRSLDQPASGGATTDPYESLTSMSPEEEAEAKKAFGDNWESAARRLA